MADDVVVAEQWPISRLVEYARNPRKNDHAVDAVAAAIREFGFKVPIVAKSDGTIVDGHLRFKAARKLGIETVPVILADDLSDAQIKAFRLSVNKVAELADWDSDLLKLELMELDEMGFDMDLTGFSMDELGALMAEPTEGLTDPDSVPDAPEHPVTVAGDAWILGRHRLVCGDSTSDDDVSKALNGVEPHLMVTDPPYGVEYDPDWRNRAEGVGGFGDPEKSKAGYKSSQATGVVLNDNRADWREAWALFPGDVAYVWHADVFSPTVAESLSACDFDLRALVVWAKSRLIIGRGHYHHMHEPCWYAVKKGRTGHWSGDRKQTTLWQIEHRKSDTGHGTQKPVECMKRPIENNSSPGQAIYEPFSGSGTTIIAAEMTGRSCHAIELNPTYVDVAVKRWQDFTGQEAILEATGATFSETQVGRCKAVV